jgi:hypothetical protein
LNTNNNELTHQDSSEFTASNSLNLSPKSLKVKKEIRANNFVSGTSSEKEVLNSADEKCNRLLSSVSKKSSKTDFCKTQK